MVQGTEPETPMQVALDDLFEGKHVDFSISKAGKAKLAL